MADLIPITCPNCSASLQIENNRQEAFCTYCGAKFLIDNKNVQTIHTIDEAAIARANAEYNIRKAEEETKQRQIASEEKEKQMATIGIILIVIISMIFLTKGL